MIYNVFQSLLEYVDSVCDTHMVAEDSNVRNEFAEWMTFWNIVYMPCVPCLYGYILKKNMVCAAR